MEQIGQHRHDDAHLVHQFFGLEALHIRQRQPGTMTGQLDSERAPDPGACACQKRDTPVKLHQSDPFFAPLRSTSWAVTSNSSDTASTMVPMALISGVTPRRIDENT